MFVRKFILAQKLSNIFINTNQMKFTKTLAAFFFLAAPLLYSCKDNGAKQKLVKTWKMVGIGGPGSARFPDSIRQQMYGTRFMEFTEEGEMIATGGISAMQRGDFTISDDGKTLFTTRNGRPSDTMIINKLTMDTLSFLIKTANLELTWVPK